MKRLRLFSLALLLALGTGASAFTPPQIAKEQSNSYSDYQDGYARGKLETEQNKCIDGMYFQQRYESYRQRAMINLNGATTQEQTDCYQGYLDGMDEGYVTPVQCAPYGSGGAVAAVAAAAGITGTVPFLPIIQNCHNQKRKSPGISRGFLYNYFKDATGRW